MTPMVLDAGALLALERRDGRMLALADEMLRLRRVGYLPAGVIAQVWRGSARQHAVARLLRSQAIRVDPLSEELGYQLGLLLARSETSDVVDAHVAFLGRLLGATVLTSDPDDLTAVDPTLRVIHV